MTDAVPVSLFLTRRALCPGCGAALQLDSGQAEIECGFCSTTSYVERRLRTVEAELREGLGPGQIEHKTRFIPAHSIGASDKAETTCPGCGGTVEISGSQDAATCPHCGSSAKVERRLVAGPEEDWSAYGDDAELEAFAARDPVDLDPEYPDGYSRWEEEARNKFWDEVDDDRIRTLLTCTDPDRRFRAAQYFQGWRQMNPWRERMLSRVMELCCDSPPELAHCIANHPIHHLLFGNSATTESRQAVFRAAGRSLFREGLSRQLMHQLGLSWDGATLKLMLELAEYQLRHDRLEDAMHALHGAAMAMRDYGMRHELGDLMLYRLLYLDPPILAWVISGSIHSWQVDDYWRVVQLADDCAFERPELIPILIDRLGAPIPPKTFREYRALLDRVDELLSPQAREFALLKYLFYPDYAKPDPGMDDLDNILRRLAPLLDDPLFHKTVRTQIVRIIGQLKYQDLPPLHEFIRRHGESLPEHIRYRYLQQRPDTELIEHFHPINLYEPDEPRPTPLRALIEEWDDKFREQHKLQDKQHEADFKLFSSMRDRIKREDNEEYERKRKLRESGREREYAESRARAKSEEAEHKRRQKEIDKQFDDWRKGSAAAAERNMEEYRKLYNETGDPIWKKMMEDARRSHEMFQARLRRRALIAAMPWPKRWLHRLMFWK